MFTGSNYRGLLVIIAHMHNYSKCVAKKVSISSALFSRNPRLTWDVLRLLVFFLLFIATSVVSLNPVQIP